MSKEQNEDAGNGVGGRDAALPAECVDGVSCNAINERPDSNYYIAFMNEAREWEAIHLRCDEGCEPGDSELFVSGAKWGIAPILRAVGMIQGGGLWSPRPRERWA